jgi:hypothetical protein
MYKKQRRDQDLVRTLNIWNSCLYILQILTPCINPDWTWSDRGGHIWLRIRNFVWVISFYPSSICHCIYGPFVLNENIRDLKYWSLGWEDVLSLRVFSLSMYRYVVTNVGQWLVTYFVYRVSSVISKMGFVMSEMGFPKIVVPVAISCSVACSAVGFVYQVWSKSTGDVHPYFIACIPQMCPFSLHRGLLL